jgi:hypothetical protein
MKCRAMELVNIVKILPVYINMTQSQNQQRCIITTGNKSFVKVSQLKCGGTLTNRKEVHDAIMRKNGEKFVIMPSI